MASRPWNCLPAHTGLGSLLDCALSYCDAHCRYRVRSSSRIVVHQRVIRARLVISLLYLVASSVCLRISPGIIVENMANLPLIAAGCILARTSSIRWPLVIFFLAAACLVKPTAVFPGLGLICGQLWFQWKNNDCRIFREVIQIAMWSLIFISFIIGLYWLNMWNARDYFWPSAVVYNTLDNSILRSAPAGNYAYILLTGFAFFQYLTAALVLWVIAIGHSRTHQLDLRMYRIVCLAVGAAIGAFASLLVRPGGPQTSYWLYLLPPLRKRGRCSVDPATSPSTPSAYHRAS